MTATTNHDLRILICEDEYLLAMDLAEQFISAGAEVVAIVGNLEAIEQEIAKQPFRANAAVLDVGFAGGSTFEAVPLLEAAGANIAFCSGYGLEERPADLAHIPWFDKPVSAQALLSGFRHALDARSDRQSA